MCSRARTALASLQPWWSLDQSAWVRGCRCRAPTHHLKPRALPSEWPFPGFVARTIAKFPDAGVCHVEEARVLEEEDGYTFLDVRTKQEYEYRIAGSVNVPIITATWRFEKGKPAKVPDPQAANLDFVNQVQAKFPTKSTKLIICCSDGRTRTLSALRALDAAGYTHLVGMKNGACGHRPPPPLL